MASGNSKRVRTKGFKFYSQSQRGRCGVAAIRSVLATQFKKNKSEEDIIHNIYEFYRQNSGCRPEQLFKDQGTSPSAMAYCFRKIVPPNNKVFCSKRGNARVLKYVLEPLRAIPVIHQMVHLPDDKKDNKKEGHYLMFAGARGNKVRVFDPSPGEGYKELAVSDFYRKWQNKDEKWFLITLPPEANLNNFAVSGRYI